MNNKVLLIIAIILAIGAGWYFGKNTKVESPIKVEPPQVDYEASQITATQTNDAGDTEYQVNAKSLSHNNITKKDELVDVTMDWKPTENKKYKLISGSTNLNQETGEMVMTNGFKLISKQMNDTGQEIAPIIIVGNTLMGNTKMKKVQTTEPIRFQQGDNQFTATGMVADLETGDYQFSDIQVYFTPSERQDQPLF